jgi:hypothetical protein
MKSAKTIGFWDFKRKKLKPKQKVLANCKTESKRQFAPVLFLGTVFKSIHLW